MDPISWFLWKHTGIKTRAQLPHLLKYDCKRSEKVKIF